MNNQQQQQKQLSSSLGRFEGCGELGLLRSIFFAEFHPVAGPMIRCQAPSKGDGAKDIVTKEMFEAVSCFIIPKPQLDRTPMTVNVQGRKNKKKIELGAIHKLRQVFFEDF